MNTQVIRKTRKQIETSIKEETLKKNYCFQKIVNRYKKDQGMQKPVVMKIIMVQGNPYQRRAEETLMIMLTKMLLLTQMKVGIAEMSVTLVTI